LLKFAAKCYTWRLVTQRETVRLPVVNRTLIIVKPDAVERGLVGEVLTRIERRELRLVAAELRTIDEATAARHYAEHEGKPFFERLVSFITSAPALVAVVEGPEDAWQVVRTMIGATNPAAAAPGTIRGDLAIDMAANLIHGSDSSEAAQREIAIFFPDLA
jgi:nucleoside-diphosphate kinase